MNFWKRAKNAVLRVKPHTGPPLMKAEPKTTAELTPAELPEPKFTLPVTVVIIWNGNIKKGHADSVMATLLDVDAGLADREALKLPPGFTVRFPDSSTTVIITEQEGLTWARGHDDETEAALAAAYALWEQAPVFGFQGSTGAQGPTGVQGSAGFQGPTGPRGSVGVQGASPGIRGPVGVQGVAGGTIPVGAQGAPTVIMMPGSGRAPP